MQSLCISCIILYRCGFSCFHPQFPLLCCSSSMFVGFSCVGFGNSEVKVVVARGSPVLFGLRIAQVFALPRSSPRGRPLTSLLHCCIRIAFLGPYSLPVFTMLQLCVFYAVWEPKHKWYQAGKSANCEITQRLSSPL